MDELAQLLRCRRTLGRERCGRAVQVELDDLGEVFTFERRMAAQRLVRHDAERVDVARGGDVLAGALLGRHVDRRAAGDTVLGEARARAEPGDSPVDDAKRKAGVELGEQDVIGLEIAMDDAADVNGREDIGDRRHQLAEVGMRDADFPRHPHREALARDQLHRDPRPAVGEHGTVVDARDPGVTEILQDRRLLDHPGVEA